MKRLTVRADEVKVGDEFVNLEDSFPFAPVATIATDGGAIEVWTTAQEYYGLSEPTLTLAPSDQVEVWR